MDINRIIEYVFFFGLLLFAGYMVWQIAAPFLSALALSAIIVTICHPLHTRILALTPRNNKTIAAFLSTVVVLLVLVLPLTLLTSLLIGEVVGFYQDLNNGEQVNTEQLLLNAEAQIENLFPGSNVDLVAQVQSLARLIAENLGTIFAGTISTIFTFFIAIIGSFYFFRDGRQMLDLVVKASPLPDDEDRLIIERTGRAVRSVATGTLLLAVIQGTLVAIGFTIVGFEHAILWGSLASAGALMPGVGTSIVTVPATIYLFVTGDVGWGIALLVWSALIVGLVDNLLGPYLIGRQNNMHPFIILISVLGGIAYFGPVGFIVGPVIVTLFFILLEFYNHYVVKAQRLTESDIDI